MIYLLDANVLITAHHLYYPVDAVPEFWEWLAHQGVAGQIKMPVETFEEVKDGGTDAERDMLYAWVQEDAHKSAILFDERSEEHTSELQSLMRISYAVFCLIKKNT